MGRPLFVKEKRQVAKVGMVVAAVVAVLAVLLVVAGIALYRPDIPYEKLEAKYARPTSKFADLPGGVRMHYRDDGDPSKPVVMLVHGYGDSFLSWEPWIAKLSPDFRVITVDLPGHGLTRAPMGFAPSQDTYADLVDALAGKLSLPPFAIVGNSMGGGVAWQVAARYPQRVNALVLVDAAGWPASTLKQPPLAFRLIQTPAGIFLVKHFETRPITGPALKADVVNKALITPAFVDRWVEVQRAPGHRDILMGMRPGKHSVATEAVLAKIAAPTLVLHGEQDVIIEPESGRKFARSIPGAKLITYPDAGHLPQVEIPDRSAADVAAFLKSHLAPAPAQAKEPA
jgi:pimeloyl-ACP methyl ester carboxylesterase